MAGVYGGFTSSAEFIDGAQRDFIPFHIAYAFIKTLIFAMLLATIPSFHGYYMKVALEVGNRCLCLDFSLYHTFLLHINSIVTGS
jgi:phospholipid/cholesterol/gamma-HCH transport system permease protein